MCLYVIMFVCKRVCVCVHAHLYVCVTIIIICSCCIDYSYSCTFATTICCSFFFPKPSTVTTTTENATFPTFLSLFLGYLTLYFYFLKKCSITFLFVFQTLIICQRKETNFSNHAAKFDLFANYMFSCIPLTKLQITIMR